MSIICIGHITRDKIVTPQQTVYLAGGTTTYVAMGLNSILRDSDSVHRKNIDFKLIASLSKKDYNVIEMMRAHNINVDIIESKETTFFENIYGENSDDRKQNVRSIGDPFTIEKLKPFLDNKYLNLNKPYIILGSLLAEDFPLETVKYCKTFGRLVMDAQGYFRHVAFQTNKKGERTGKVQECNWEGKEQFLANIDILKLNENEARLITNENDLHKAVWQLHQQGISEVLLTLGRQGSIIAAEGKVIDIDVVPETKCIDATGCGDTYVIAYIYRRSQGDSPIDAAKFASSAATFKLEGTGPLNASEKEIKERIANTK